MARLARVVVPGVAHHVTHRGNNRQDVFFVEEDREQYLRILREQSSRHGLSLRGFCLMTNHIHLIAVPAGSESLALAIGRTHWKYAQYVNRVHGRTGHLWQNRYYSCALDDAHQVAAMVYVEYNPVRAGLAERPWEYKWSSARAHVSGEDEFQLLELAQWRKALFGHDWKEWLRRGEDEKAVANLRYSTIRGRPLGSDAFISKLEAAAGRRLRPRPVGRPIILPKGK